MATAAVPAMLSSRSMSARSKVPTRLLITSSTPITWSATISGTAIRERVVRPEQASMLR